MSLLRKTGSPPLFANYTPQERRQQLRMKLTLELIWWVMTAVVAFLVIYPMQQLFTDYEFLYANVLFVVVFVTFTRYLFLLKHTLLAYWQAGKLLLIFVCLPLVFHLIANIHGFQEFLDSEGLLSFEQYFRPGVKPETKSLLLGYMQRELLFFGVASVIVSIMLPFRMLVSIWRVYNNREKV